MKTCTKCRVEKEFKDFCKQAKGKDGLRSTCRVCHSQAAKTWWEDNKERGKKVSAIWRENNREKMNKLVSEWGKNNRDKRNHSYNKYRGQKLNATPIWFEEYEIRKLYKKAKKLSMHVDHIVPLQNELVCGLHCLSNLQLLTQQDNLAKSNSFVVGG